MADFIDGVHKSLKSIISILNVFPWLQYLPKYRQPVRQAMVELNRIADIVDAGIDEALLAENDKESFVRRYAETQLDRTKLTCLMMDMMAAGSQTVSGTLRWSLILLANHPNVQARLQTEIDFVVPREELFPSLDDRPRLPYVESVILKVIRYKTLFPFLSLRQAPRATKIESYDIPADKT